MEAHPDAEAATFNLGPSGRFRHSHAYVAAELEEAGFQTEMLQAVHLRLELGEPVDGYLVVARRLA